MTDESSGYLDGELEESIEIFIQYQNEIVASRSGIENAFRSVLKSEKITTNFDKLADYLAIAVSSNLDEESDANEVSNSIINSVTNYTQDTKEEYVDLGANDDALSLLSDLHSEFGYDIQQIFNRQNKGVDWWSNISTDVGIRSNSPVFKHELRIDYNKVMSFSSDMESALTLTQHIFQKVANSPELLGEDALAYVNEDRVEDLNEATEKLLDELAEYDDDFQSVDAKVTEQAEKTSDE